MSNFASLNTFIAWASDFSKSEEGGRLVAKVTISPPSDNPSARLDVCSSVAMGRITNWSDGSYFSEVLDLATERSRFERSGFIADDELLSEIFFDFFGAMRKS